MLAITVESAASRSLSDLAALGRRWRALEAHADPGFFRSWTFLGCLAELRFSNATVLSVRKDGQDVALALLGRTPGRAWLHQTGRRAEDAPFIEHNGLLVRTGHDRVVRAALRLAVRHTGSLVLSGIDAATLEAARGAGWLELHQSRVAPYVDLTRLSGDYVETLSANARAQIRRSQRLYGAELGLTRAESLAEALAIFDELVALHQAGWARRGKPGAFADPLMRDFHTELITRAWPLGQADLLRIAAGPRVIGALYHFLRDGHVYSYQSGFAETAEAKEKPGLVCHAMAIAHYAARGQRVYDLLAGEDRYKLTLAGGRETLHWATLHRPFSAAGLKSVAKAGVRGILSGRR